MGAIISLFLTKQNHLLQFILCDEFYAIAAWFSALFREIRRTNLSPSSTWSQSYKIKVVKKET